MFWSADPEPVGPSTIFVQGIFLALPLPLGAFIQNTYLACQQRPETKNLGDDMSTTSCKTGTS